MISFKVNGYRETIELKRNLNFESFQNFWNVLNVTPVIVQRRFTPPLTPPLPTPRTNFFITLELLKVRSWNFDSIKSNSLERFLSWNQIPLQLLRICKWLILRLTFLDKNTRVLIHYIIRCIPGTNFNFIAWVEIPGTV